MSEKKLIKITLEYDNGDVSYLEGSEAERWSKAVDGAIVMNAIHGNEFPEFKWKKVREEEQT